MRPLRAALLLSVFAAAFPARAQRIRPVVRFAAPPPARNVLWIAAHPDDELLAAPLLDLYCREREVRCTFAVATRGESGWCELPLCAPDLATVRELEVRASASFFSAALVLGTFPDGSSSAPGDVLLRWDSGTATLDVFLDSFSRQIRPDLVLTLDPRHGSTCHPDHRAIGGAALEAVDRAPRCPRGVVRDARSRIGEWDALAVDPNLRVPTPSSTLSTG